jgi:hypothetical protein
MQIIKRCSDSRAVLTLGPDNKAYANLRDMLDPAGYRDGIQDSQSTGVFDVNLGGYLRRSVA